MRQRGFTYLGLIILVAILGLVGAASLKATALLQRAAAEEELLETGAAFSDALASYAAVTPQGQPLQPPTLQELLRDPRSPTVRRHLRKVFVDPMTGKAEWGVMYLGDKVGVIGVYSLSDARPLKIANFDTRFLNMENREKISDWKFMMPQQAAMMAPTQNRPRPTSAPGGAAAPVSVSAPVSASAAASTPSGTPAPVSAPVAPPPGPEPEVAPPPEEEAPRPEAENKDADERAEAQDDAQAEARREAQREAQAEGQSPGMDPARRR